MRPLLTFVLALTGGCGLTSEPGKAFDDAHAVGIHDAGSPELDAGLRADAARRADAGVADAGVDLDANAGRDAVVADAGDDGVVDASTDVLPDPVDARADGGDRGVDASDAGRDAGAARDGASDRGD